MTLILMEDFDDHKNDMDENVIDYDDNDDNEVGDTGEDKCQT